MRACHYCRWNGAHDASCPESADPLAKPGAMRDWSRGYADGRAGLDAARSETRRYAMGWSVGNIALEEYENGHNPYTDE